MSKQQDNAMAGVAEKRALVPKLRFPEFWGAAGWETTPLGELGLIVTGKTPSTKENDLWGGKIPFITPTDITEDEKYQHTTQRTVVETTSIKVLPPGSVVYTCIASIGKMALTVFPSITNQQINAVVPNGKAAREFIYYSLANLTPWIKSIPATSTLPIINKTQFSGFIIPHPEDKSEQQKIADCLSSLDELMAAQARKVEALKTHKKGLMQQLFPREGETQPRLRFPEFKNAEEWEVDRFDGLIEVIDGDRGSNYPKAEEYSKSGFCLFLSAANVSKAGFKFDAMQFISKEKDESLRKGKLKRADVVLTTRGTVGQFAFYSEEIPYENIRINSGMVILRIKTKKIVPIYLYGFTNSEILSSHIKNTAFGNAQQQLTVGEINKFQLYYPSPDEQQCIASCLSSLDTLITLETQKLATLKTHKKGLMQQLFPSAQAVNE